MKSDSERTTDEKSDQTRVNGLSDTKHDAASTMKPWPLPWSHGLYERDMNGRE